MQNDTAQAVGRVPLALPVVRGERWFGPAPRPFVLRIELPITFEEMVAALYGVVEPGEIDTSEDLCGCAAVTLLIEGVPAVQKRVARLRASESSGGVEAPEFLELCRLRVAALLAA